MTQREQIAALKREVAELREKVEQLEASSGGTHIHHHYPPSPPPPNPIMQPFTPFRSPNTCSSGQATLRFPTGSLSVGM